MIKLRPITTAQTFNIIPSSFVEGELNASTLSITENGTNLSEADASFTWTLSDNGNYVIISLTPTLTFKEDQIYSLELSTSTKVLYRDLIYITSKTNKKQTFAVPDIYTEYDDGDDQYIVL